MSHFSSVSQAPADPILGLTAAYNEDANPDKVNLGVGVYQDENGRLPLLDCVKVAIERIAAHPDPLGYQPIDGQVAYTSAVKSLVFGADHPAVTEGRIVTVQGLGGTGALRIGAAFSRLIDPNASVLLSDPSWENHRAVFTQAGLNVAEYRYYDAENRCVDVAGMLEDLSSAAAGTVVVLHACCHNPTGYDLTDEQWGQVLDVVRQRDLVAFLDMAYQGFSRGLDEDAAVLRRFADSGLTFLAATSFSKNFGLYGERVGALHVVCADADEAKRVTSQVKIIIRTLWSNPPTEGNRIVTTILGDDALTAQWQTELAGMRDRIKTVRASLAEGLRAAGVTTDVGYITDQVGMFSYSGLTVEQMRRLRSEFGVYGTDKGRICVAAINQGNVDHVSRAIAEVMKG